ncbi:flagellar hook-length control protein FliK [Nitrosomonas sp.]|uniref:flagellar hook-length control protein FliK n=1 Tax=Nitrosomonas sp. TaxID=42353 RepID=UPI001D2D8B6C|nr:flagellar hook-length control protein FliK [Nitrosomonas sp.]MBX3615703.1 flagellar hook-length control protein FliK [Nitrosomonas sp.]
MSVAPSIKTPTENSTATADSGLLGISDPVSEEFSNILEREVSQTTNSRGKSNTDSNAKPEEQSDETETAPAEATDTKTAETVSADNMSNFIQNLLSGDPTLGFRSNQPLNQLNTLPEPALKAPLTDALTSKLPAILNPSTSQNAEAALNPAFPAINQLLQQTQVGNDLNSQANQFWQMIGSANSASDGKLLPLTSELTEAIATNTNDSFLSVHGESNSQQSLGLSNAMSSVTSTTSSSDIQVNQPVGHTKWGGEFAQKVVWLTSQQQQVAEIHLNPAHLGPVDVMLTITQDQATAQFLSPHPAVREAIEQALPKLREMMADNGIQLGNVMVGADSFQQENRQQHANHSDKGNASMTNARAETTNQTETLTIPVKHQGIVNTYA